MRSMSQSLAKIIVHIVFSTKNHTPFLSGDIRKKLFAYLAGILKKLDCSPILINGVEDHVHILCLLSKNQMPCNVVEKLKAYSSKWIKTETPAAKDFQWQNVYGIFSVSQSNLASVKDYISGQNDHHRRSSFKDEFRAFIKNYDVQYDEQYVWD